MKRVKESDLEFLKNIYNNAFGCDANAKLEKMSEEALHELSERVNNRLELILTQENKKYLICCLEKESQLLKYQRN